ncbi:MAG TPA: CbiX/SirB N-terminal domain-containing protein [Burkholderiales bacterium]
MHAGSAIVLFAHGARDSTVVPLFPARGGHLKHDVPHLMAEPRHRHCGATTRLACAIGNLAAIPQEIVRWVRREHPR